MKMQTDIGDTFDFFVMLTRMKNPNSWMVVKASHGMSHEQYEEMINATAELRQRELRRRIDRGLL